MANFPKQAPSIGRSTALPGKAGATGATGAPGASGGVDLTPVTAKNSNYAANSGELVPVNATNQPVTVTLPSAPATGAVVAVKRQSLPSSNTVTVATQSTDVIDAIGASTRALAISEDAISVRYAAAGAGAAYNTAVSATSGLVSYWRLIDGSSTAAADSKDSNPGVYPTGYAASIVAAPGLLGYWRLNESTGPVADSSTGGHPGTLIGSTITLGNPGHIASDTSAQFFHDSAANIRVRNDGNPIVGGLSNWTMEAWVKTTASQSRASIYDERAPGLPNPTPQAILCFDSGMKASIIFLDNVNSFFLFGGNPLNDGIWHHVVGTRAANTFTIFVDGVQVAQTTSTVTTSFSAAGMQCMIGGDPTDSVLAYNGFVQHVAVYGNTLTPAIVAAHYNLGQGAPNWQSSPGALTPSGDLSPAAVVIGPPVTVPDAANLRLTASLTVECWVNPSTVSGAQKIVSKLAAGVGYEFGLTGTHLYLTTNATTVTGTQTLAANSWQHVAVTLSGTTVTFYVNGVSGTGGTGVAPTTTTTGLTIGSGFNGEMQEAAVYNSALSGATIAAHYADGTLFSVGVWYSEVGPSQASLEFRYVSVKPGQPAYFGTYPYQAAKGDNTTDDSPVFQQALNDLSSVVGGELVMPLPPGGAYLFSNPVNATGLSGVTIRGVGNASQALNGVEINYTGTGANPAVYLKSPVGVTWQNIGLYGQQATAFTGSLLKADSSGGSDVFRLNVDGCTFLNPHNSPANGLSVSAFQGSRVTGSNFNGGARAVIWGEAAFTNSSVLRDCTFGLSSLNPIYIQNGDAETNLFENLMFEPLVDGSQGAFEGNGSLMYSNTWINMFVLEGATAVGTVFKNMVNANRVCTMIGCAIGGEVGAGFGPAGSVGAFLQGTWILIGCKFYGDGAAFATDAGNHLGLTLIGGSMSTSVGTVFAASPPPSLYSLGFAGLTDTLPYEAPLAPGAPSALQVSMGGQVLIGTAPVGGRAVTINPHTAGFASTMPVGWQCQIFNSGTAHTLAVAGASVTLDAPAGANIVPLGMAQVTQVALDVWQVQGQLTTVAS